MSGELVFLLEEESAKAMLDIIMRKLAPGVICQYHPFEGKSDLDKHLVEKIRGYRVPGARFIVIRDKDSGDCKQIKNELTDKIGKIGKISENKKALIRIACHELESFYLGDLPAVEKGMKINLSRNLNKRKYQDPDKLANPSQILGRLTKNQYQKINGSRAIASHLNLDGSNKSASFNALIDGIRKQLKQLPVTSK